MSDEETVQLKVSGTIEREWCAHIVDDVWSESRATERRTAWIRTALGPEIKVLTDVTESGKSGGMPPQFQSTFLSGPQIIGTSRGF